MFKDRAIEVKETVKNHIKRNKKKYVVGGVVVAVGVTFVVTRKIYKPKITVWDIFPAGKKNLGLRYILRCDQNQRMYWSQKEAAQTLRIDPSSLSRHLNNPKDPRYKDVGGYTFKREGILI